MTREFNRKSHPEFGWLFLSMKKKHRAVAYCNSPIVIGIDSYLKTEKIFWKKALILARSLWNQLSDCSASSTASW